MFFEIIFMFIGFIVNNRSIKLDMRLYCLGKIIVLFFKNL